MKYAVISVRNGTYHIDAEGYTDMKDAIIKFHSVCSTLWNAEDLKSGCVIIANEQLLAVDGYREMIKKINNRNILIPIEYVFNDD